MFLRGVSSDNPFLSVGGGNNGGLGSLAAKREAAKRGSRTVRPFIR